jgi:hypothetical protein
MRMTEVLAVLFETFKTMSPKSRSFERVRTRIIRSYRNPSNGPWYWMLKAEP